MAETIDAPADAWALAQRLADRAPTADDLQVLADGFARWLRDGGDRPLESCLGLVSDAKRRAAVRDAELRKAAELLRPLEGMPRATRLQEAWARLLCHADYAAWGRTAGPPADAAPLRVALYWAGRYNDDSTLSPKHITRIVGT